MPESGSVVPVFGSESAWPGVGATTVWSEATEVTAGDFMGLGKVAADSLGPPEAGFAGAASTGFCSAGAAPAGFASAGFASAGGEDLPALPLPLPGDGIFGLVGRDAARRAGVAGGGVTPEADDLPVSADFDGEPRASATVISDDLSPPSGASPFLVVDSGLSSTLSRTTVSG